MDYAILPLIVLFIFNNVQVLKLSQLNLFKKLNQMYYLLLAYHNNLIIIFFFQFLTLIDYDKYLSFLNNHNLDLLRYIIFQTYIQLKHQTFYFYLFIKAFSVKQIIVKFMRWKRFIFFYLNLKVILIIIFQQDQIIHTLLQFIQIVN